MRNLSKFKGTPRNNRSFIASSFSYFTYKILSNILFSSDMRVLVFRFLGAKVGRGVKIGHHVKVRNFRNLQIGDDSWIGEEVWFINHEKITIGSNVCISQRAIICSGSHDFRSSSFEHAHKPIEIKEGAWVCLDAKILPGVTVGECSVVSAGEVARKSIPDNSILVSGEVRSIDPPR